MLLITYFGEHNHPLLATTKHHHHHLSTVAASTDSTSTTTTTSTSASSVPAKFPPEECAVFANQPDLEPADNGFVELAGELGWFADVGFTVMDCPTLVGPSWAHSDVEVFMPIGEEDESLFGDLGDLPESSVVLRRCQVETPCCGGTG